MMRPKLRPTLSRKVKYWGIAPTAQKKLGKEARRGEHDLRRLVGHANFLDVLVSELDVSDYEDEVTSPVQAPAPAVSNKSTRVDVEAEHAELDDEDTASDSWSEYDSSDDEDHALVRTVSGRPSATDLNVGARENNNSELIVENMKDYFQFDQPQPAIIAIEDALDGREALQHVEGPKKDAIVSVAIVSPTMTPLASPTDEIELSTTG